MNQTNPVNSVGIAIYFNTRIKHNLLFQNLNEENKKCIYFNKLYLTVTYVNMDF